MSNLITNNTIIGYVNGKAIAVDENDNLLYLEMPEEYALKGEVLEGGKFISELSGEEINQIYIHLAGEV